ncbi:MAG: hypothetical protein H6738_24575 [Alphaproteobacteria bacterium]|nr:hypothetical protein [Alphaproteobacteria bacterium]MCB9699986.1 hypothetical protein [Alphaproteobacteria bacterium]
MSDALVPYRLARRVGDALDRCGVPWVVGGSLASSVHGMPRSTHDVDLVARLAPTQRAALHDELVAMGYVDPDAMGAAIAQGRAFNFIDDATCEKVDVFCVDARRAGQIERARQIEVAPDLSLPILSPEDTVSQKLRWYDLGGRTSQRQWRDVLEVLRVQGASIDGTLLRSLAQQLEVTDLLDLAVAELSRSR